MGMGNQNRTIKQMEDGDGGYKVASKNRSEVASDQDSLELGNAREVEPGQEQDGVISDICFFTWRGRRVDQEYFDQF